MIRNIGLEDALNVNNHRNSSNTETMTFNCAGFALGTYSWYIPCEDRYSDLWDIFGEMNIDFCDDEIDRIYDHIAGISIRNLKRDFAHRNLHQICRLADAKENEIVIAFRFSLSDFHFMKRFPDGRWFEKCGGLEIHPVDEADVFKDIWHNVFEHYDSEIYLFAMNDELE